VRFAFVDAKKAKYPVVVLCEVLNVGPSGYYAWSAREMSTREREDQRLVVEIRAIFEEFKRRYGSPRVCRELRLRGTRVCRHRVARLMREQRLKARPRRRFVKTTDSTHSMQTPANVLDRKFTATAPDRVWAGDVTYLPTREGWLYLAVLLDLYSRRVVGWAMSEHNDEALTLAALTMALDQRQPEPGLLHHTDRGTTYASGTYQDVLAQHGITCSMSRKGNCWDNAVVESFFGTLKRELVEGADFEDHCSAQSALFEYIEVFYNRRRRHTSLDYWSPAEYEGLAT